MGASANPLTVKDAQGRDDAHRHSSTRTSSMGVRKPRTVICTNELGELGAGGSYIAMR